MSPGVLGEALGALLLEVTLKGSVFVLVVGVVAFALGHRSAADRHLVWTVGVVGLLLLPAIALVGPTWPVSVPEGVARLLPAPLEGSSTVPLPAGRPGPPGETAGATPARARPPSESGLGSAERGVGTPPSTPTGRPEAAGGVGLVAGVWLLGALGVLTSFVLAWSRLGAVVRQARPLEGDAWETRVAHAARAVGVDPARVVLLRATTPLTPLTWGVWRPVVILPPSCEDWSEEQRHTVLVHEISHVRRHDCLSQTLASLACVVHWFNPLAWLAARRMLTERERACDDQVLLAGAKASDYANDLLEIARSLGAPWTTSQVSTAMARRSQIAGRLLAVLDPDLARGGGGWGRMAVAAALGLLLVLPLATVRAAPPSGALATTASGAVTPAPPAAVDLAEAGRALDAQNEGLAAALRRGDTEALSRFYTTDAELVVPTFPVARGRGAIRDLYEHLVTGGVTVLEHTTVERYAVGGLVCEVRISRLRHRSGTEVQSNREMTLWRQEDGAWRVHREVSVPGAE